MIATKILLSGQLPGGYAQYPTSSGSQIPSASQITPPGNDSFLFSLALSKFNQIDFYRTNSARSVAISTWCR